jgi:hypothetical protein
MEELQAVAEAAVEEELVVLVAVTPAAAAADAREFSGATATGDM